MKFVSPFVFPEGIKPLLIREISNKVYSTIRNKKKKEKGKEREKLVTPNSQRPGLAKSQNQVSNGSCRQNLRNS